MRTSFFIMLLGINLFGETVQQDQTKKAGWKNHFNEEKISERPHKKIFIKKPEKWWSFSSLFGSSKNYVLHGKQYLENYMHPDRYVTSHGPLSVTHLDVETLIVHGPLTGVEIKSKKLQVHGPMDAKEVFCKEGHFLGPVDIEEISAETIEVNGKAELSFFEITNTLVIRGFTVLNIGYAHHIDILGCVNAKNIKSNEIFITGKCYFKKVFAEKVSLRGEVKIEKSNIKNLICKKVDTKKHHHENEICITNSIIPSLIVEGKNRRVVLADKTVIGDIKFSEGLGTVIATDNNIVVQGKITGGIIINEYDKKNKNS